MGETIEGRNPVLEALRAGRPVNRVLIAKGVILRGVEEVRALARERGIPVQEVDRSKLDALSTTGRHQGVVAMASPIEYVEPENFLATARQQGEETLVVILDNIEDPQNVGAILRVADAVGVHGVVLPRHGGAPLTAAVGRASAGAMEYVPVARVPNLARTIEEFKRDGLWVVGTAPDAPDMLFERDLTGPLAVVIGSEGRGMGRLVREKCDFLVKLPMRGHVGSLNAASAAAVLLYEVLRQRFHK